MPPPTAILETVLYAEDIAAAEAFYRDVIGLDLVRRLPGKFAFFRAGRQMLLLFQPEASARPDPANPIPRHGARGAGHVCFRATATQIDAWRDRLLAKGHPIEADHRWPDTGGRSIYVRDPAGNSVEFAEPRIWGLD